MPWSTPVAGIAGTVITAAWSTANVVNPLNWLRQLTGNADPPGTGYVVTSDSTSTTSWKTGATAGASIFGSAPVLVGGSEMTGPLKIANGTEIQLSEGSGFARYVLKMVAHAQELGNPNNVMVFRGSQLQVPNAIYLGLMEASGFVRTVLRMNTSDVIEFGNTNNVLNLLGTVQVGGSTPWTAANDGTGSNLDADLLDGVQGSGYALAAAGVPSGMIAAFRTAAAIPAGWSRFNDGNGRMLVGAGATFSQTFTEDTAVGANWTPFAGASGFTGTAADVFNAAAGATAVSSATHQNSLSIAAQTWTPVARIVVYAIKS